MYRLYTVLVIPLEGHVSGTLTPSSSPSAFAPAIDTESRTRVAPNIFNILGLLERKTLGRGRGVKDGRRQGIGEFSVLPSAPNNPKALSNSFPRYNNIKISQKAQIISIIFSLTFKNKKGMYISSSIPYRLPTEIQSALIFSKKTLSTFLYLHLIGRGNPKIK